MHAMQIQIFSLSGHWVNTVTDSFGLTQKMVATDPVCDRNDATEPANIALEINYSILFFIS